MDEEKKLKEKKIKLINYFYIFFKFIFPCFPLYQDLIILKYINLQLILIIFDFLSYF